MNPVRLLLRLYPAAFRERWGAALEADASAAGRRSWPGLLASAADLWLHPVIWPAASASQRRHRAAAAAFTLTLATWLVGRAGTANDPRLTWRAHRALNVAECAAFMLLGAIMIMPLPRPTRQAVTALLRRTLQALAAPAVLLFAELILVHFLRPAAHSAAHLAFTALYWFTLALGALQAARIVGTVSSSAVTPPRPARLRLGIAVLATGCALTAWISLSSTVTGHGLDAVSAATSGGMLMLTAWFLSILRDVNEC
ncbi:hypothetical protein KDK95_16160 [Actinospica sp. MGRD01-02]|uniref:DUF998 domain-containing protein n=1 Tax=Actinospica acidithermotolerans TaxID=2828514 RepID=A0A941EHQ4_9ACTN|nr:hypothetical protein [Actinospica acidithermotolerans]MBR7827854.1 hypothetical protein [Actinospica acidithermotolerans]